MAGLAAGLSALLLGACGRSPAIRLATTTSVEASGLLDRLLPDLLAQTGVTVEPIAVGSGKALRLLERGDADFSITHDPDGERALVARGVAQRRELMRNDFVLLGPPSDPAGVRGARDIASALARIAAVGATFVSRGDDSGTHRAERRLWSAAAATPGRDAWYRETGQGQGETLQAAHETRGYTLCDTSTFHSYRARLELAIVVEGDARLRNLYSALIPVRLEGRRRRDVLRAVGWLRGATARAHMRALRFEAIP